MKMDGRVAFVTGAGAGIGRATALRFASMGSAVLAADINERTAQETAELITANGGRAVACGLDVGDPGAVQAAVAFTLEKLGGLDYAHNNAGFSGRPALLENAPLEEWGEILRVNLSGIFYCMKFQLAHMSSQGTGAIVNTASTAGLGGTPLMGAYAASKHGVVGLTKTAAVDYASQGIRVNAVCPGTTATQMLMDLIGDDDDQRRSYESSNPMNRLGSVDELAAAAVFLCSDDAAYITGQALAVDGGLAAMMGAGSLAEG